VFSRVALLFAAFASLGALATGCGGGGDEGGDGRLTVVVTVAPVGALVSAVAGSDADVRVLVGPGVDPHDYELKAADRRAVERADVIFRNGLGLDAFLDRALKDSNGTIVTLSDGLMLRAPDEEPHAAGGAHAHEGEGSLQMLNRKQPIRVRSSLGRAIHNRRRCHEYTGINCVHCIVRIVFTSHPMDRGIEMCTRVFTTGEVVPVPSGSFLVVATDSFLLEGPHLTELWRQLERREVG